MSLAKHEKPFGAVKPGVTVTTQDPEVPEENFPAVAPPEEAVKEQPDTLVEPVETNPVPSNLPEP